MKKENVIGMVLPTMDNSFFSALAVHVERTMALKGYRTLLVSCDNNADKEKDYYRLFDEMNLSGIISISGLSELPAELALSEMPLVWVDRVPESSRDIPWVANDDAKAMEIAVDHLIERGSRNILLLPGYLAEKQESPRVRGYKTALKKHGIEFHEEYVLHRPGRLSSEVETGQLIRESLRNLTDVDGVITSSDRAAFGAMKTLQNIGYFVPEDVRLISFDNSTYSSLASPSVTSLDRKADRLAGRACDILDNLIRHDSEISVENIIPVSLEMKDSTR